MLKRFFTSAVAVVGYAQLHFALRFAPVRTEGLLRIYDLESDESQGSVALEKVAAAVRMTTNYAPRRAHRLMRDVKRIIVITNPVGAASYMHGMRAVFIDRASLLATSTSVVAALLVHEAAHARLWLAGISHDVARHRRLERRCNLEMLDFVRQIPDAPLLIEWATRTLSQTMSSAEEQALIARRKDAWLRRLGLPDWLVRVLRRTVYPEG